jgi:TRAP-type C4-dicarboxylate transport system permease small subunit
VAYKDRMSGFFGKLLTIAAVIAVAWFGWRWWQRQIEKPTAKAQPPQSPPPAGPAARQGKPAVEDLVACGVCGAYVPAGTMHCDRRA